MGLVRILIDRDQEYAEPALPQGLRELYDGDLHFPAPPTQRPRLHVRADHSVRSAFIGAILAARFAGTIAAINEQMPSAKVAVPRAGGSHHLTP